MLRVLESKTTWQFTYSYFESMESVLNAAKCGASQCWMLQIWRIDFQIRGSQLPLFAESFCFCETIHAIPIMCVYQPRVDYRWSKLGVPKIIPGVKINKGIGRSPWGLRFFFFVFGKFIPKCWKVKVENAKNTPPNCYKGNLENNSIMSVSGIPGNFGPSLRHLSSPISWQAGAGKFLAVSQRWHKKTSEFSLFFLKQDLAQQKNPRHTDLLTHCYPNTPLQRFTCLLTSSCL